MTLLDSIAKKTAFLLQAKAEGRNRAVQALGGSAGDTAGSGLRAGGTSNQTGTGLKAGLLHERLPLCAMRPDLAAVVIEEAADAPWFLGSRKSAIDLYVAVMTHQLDNYEVASACDSTRSFLDVLTNWYIRRSRERFWKSEKDADKRAAYDTLYTVLVTLTRTMAPFCRPATLLNSA